MSLDVNLGKPQSQIHWLTSQRALQFGFSQCRQLVNEPCCRRRSSHLRRRIARRSSQSANRSAPASISRISTMETTPIETKKHTTAGQPSESNQITKVRDFIAAYPP